MIYNWVDKHGSEVKLMSTTKETTVDKKNIDVKVMIENLKLIPKNRQYYIDGYTQAILDTLAEQNQNKPA